MKNVFSKCVSGVAMLSMVMSMALPMTALASAVVVNPALSNSCGLDIALVMDVSTSIDNSELAQMRSAFHGFVDALNPSTPTEFSLTKFSDSASVVEGFTSDATVINGAIDTTDGSGSTNWEAGLIAANGTFDPRGDHPNLIIFASDGNPNRTVADGSTTESVATAAAVVVADSIKTGGTRIVTIGIGGGQGDLQALDPANLKAISSADAYYETSNFSDLETALQTIATDLCGGTLTVTKVVNNGAPKAGWVFTVNGTDYTTDANGQTTAIALDNGSYSVVEKSGPEGAEYELTDASCSGASNNGTLTLAESTVAGVTMATDNIISCTFYNTVAISGCMDDSATNYNPDANVSNPSSCTYPEVDVCPFVDGLQTTGQCASDQCVSPATWDVQTQSCKTPVLLCTDESANNVGQPLPCTYTSNPAFDLGVTKSVNDSTPAHNQQISYTIVAHNYGPDTAPSVVVNDVLPAGLTYVSTTSTSQGSYNSGTGVWTVGSLINGASATLVVKVKVTASANAVVVNTATVTGDQNVEGSNSNTSSVSVTVHNTSGGGSSGGSVPTFGGSEPKGEVLGAETQALCSFGIDTYMRKGYKNNVEQVKVLQWLLNKYVNPVPPLVVDGVFGPLTETNVKSFQAKYADDILKNAWGISSPTGIFFRASLAKAKNLECPTTPTPLPVGLTNEYNWEKSTDVVPTPAR